MVHKIVETDAKVVTDAFFNPTNDNSELRQTIKYCRSLLPMEFYSLHYVPRSANAAADILANAANERFKKKNYVKIITQTGTFILNHQNQNTGFAEAYLNP